MTEQEKQAARDKAKVYAELQGIEFVDPYPDAAANTTPPAGAGYVVPPVTPIEDLSNEQLLEMLSKKGIKVSSLDDLLPRKTEEELKADADKRKNDMLAFGLSTGKFKKEEYDSYLRLQDNKMDVIKSELKEKIKVANPELSDEQIEEKVALYTFAHLEEGDVLRTQREQELIELADAKLQKQFKNIYNLENDFEQHEQGINNKTNFENKVKAALPVYQKDISTVLDSLKVIDVPVNDTKNPENNVTVQVRFSDTDLKELEDAFLLPDQIIQRVKNGYTVERLKEEAETVLLKKHFARAVSQAAKDYNSLQKEKYLHGRKGLLSTTGTDGLSISDDEMATTRQEMYDQLLANAPK